uniref:Uncharacterized protein n=1 Tax=viral metagenome TaxID=1070528 RepID=A0A6M3IHY6_9ZZZZ
MGVYEGRLTRAEIRRAGENGKYLEEKGRRRGGIRFFSHKWMPFESDEVDMQSILKAVEQIPKPDEPHKGKLEPGELEIRFVSGEEYVSPEAVKPPPGIVADRISDEELAKAREEELESRKKRGRPKKKKEA